MPETTIPTPTEVGRALAVLDAVIAGGQDEFQLSDDGRRELKDGADTLSWLRRQADFRAWTNRALLNENTNEPTEG